jgi:uncharacterized protein
MSRVILVENEYESKLIDALKQFGADEFRDKKVLIKLHMGEMGNKWFVEPRIVKIVADYLKSIGAKPVLFDTVVMYPMPRGFKTGYLAIAKKHGFGKVGCPIVIGDGGGEVSVEGLKFEIAREVLEYDHMIVISHAKGHCAAGFGGAIKNIGMGCASKKCKRFVHTEICAPTVDESKCVLCKDCEKACKQKAIRVDKKWSISLGQCVGCDECIKRCPQKALGYKREKLGHMLAYSSKAATSHMKKMLFVNVLLKITKNCDCFPNALPIIADDIGMMVSDGMVSVDKASIDIIEGKMKKTFLEIHSADPMDQITTAEKMGLGSPKYTLERI